MRGPWHDIGSSVVGKAASIVGRHFIERWNNAIYTCFKASTKIKTRDHNNIKITDKGFHQSFLRARIGRSLDP